MSYRPITIVTGGVYHIYNRGAHKADVFKNERDYVRFQLLLHLCNTNENIRVSDVLHGVDGNLVSAFAEGVDHSLVDVLGYCLMKNHIHMIVRPKVDGGLQKFMQKVMTGYSMYANKLYNHTGTMWEGRFKAKHVSKDGYLWQLFAYIHVNPIEYMAKFWKDDKSLDCDAAVAYLRGFYQSSFIDFYPLTKEPRPHSVVLAREDAFTKFLKQYPRPQNLIEYYLKQDFSEV